MSFIPLGAARRSIVYADADQAVLSAKESDELVDTVTKWPNDF
jgi:hypothetical protein